MKRPDRRQRDLPAYVPPLVATRCCGRAGTVAVCHGGACCLYEVGCGYCTPSVAVDLPAAGHSGVAQASGAPTCHAGGLAAGPDAPVWLFPTAANAASGRKPCRLGQPRGGPVGRERKKRKRPGNAERRGQSDEKEKAKQKRKENSCVRGALPERAPPRADAGARGPPGGARRAGARGPRGAAGRRPRGLVPAARGTRRSGGGRRPPLLRASDGCGGRRGGRWVDGCRRWAAFLTQFQPAVVDV